MSQSTSLSNSLFSLAAVTALAVATISTVIVAPDLAFAGDKKSSETRPSQSPVPPASGTGSCACPSTSAKPAIKPKFAELPPQAQRTTLDETDEVAALESVQFALSEVGDGASYIWHRNNGRLSGMVQPVASFKDRTGQICRHVLVVLTAGTHSKKAEGVACRLPTGQWKLEG
jgi:surface antigen